MGYQLNDKLLERMSRHSVDNLEQEILLAKAVLETRLAACETEAEIVAIVPLLMSSLTQIEKMTADYRRFQEASSRTLTKTAAMQLMREIVDVISGHVKHLPGHENIVDAIAKDIATKIKEAKNSEEVTE